MFTVIGFRKLVFLCFGLLGVYEEIYEFYLVVLVVRFILKYSVIVYFKLIGSG